MWKALERIIPDVRKRTEVELVATPLTHEFFNRRFKGEDSLAESLCFVPKPCSPGTRAWTHVTRILDKLHMGNAFVACHWWMCLILDRPPVNYSERPFRPGCECGGGGNVADTCQLNRFSFQHQRYGTCSTITTAPSVSEPFDRLLRAWVESRRSRIPRLRNAAEGFATLWGLHAAWAWAAGSCCQRDERREVSVVAVVVG